ncbi:MAG TPA: pirin-like C-terminal cupin domain-containing protein, partial [Thermoanaerobaculia bacterium]|nr:pirin-like C-terminal cupin domain-containing protein [Thermoanaerobaculia bacterium]
ELWLDLNRRFEHALFVLDGTATLEGEQLSPDILYYLAPDRAELSLSSPDGARLLLLGGTPFEERILMWWNFVARTHDEIERARSEWQTGTRFGEVKGYAGPRIDAPAIIGRAAPPNPAS